MLRKVTLKQIEAFYWTAELGSFSAAAGRLNTTQPAISNRIREFETALDLKIFAADVRCPRLTPMGRESRESWESRESRESGTWEE